MFPLGEKNGFLYPEPFFSSLPQSNGGNGKFSHRSNKISLLRHCKEEVENIRYAQWETDSPAFVSMSFNELKEYVIPET